MHKKDAPGADLELLNAMGWIHYTNSDFIVRNASGHLSGKRSTIVLRGDSIGSNCGSLRAILSGCFAGCLATAHIRSAA